jgi:hypothetical protein
MAIVCCTNELVNNDVEQEWSVTALSCLFAWMMIKMMIILRIMSAIIFSDGSNITNCCRSIVASRHVAAAIVAEATFKAAASISGPLSHRQSMLYSTRAGSCLGYSSPPPFRVSSNMSLLIFPATFLVAT